MSIQAVIFDRDGVLTDFDVEGAVAFFSSLLPISLQELSTRWNCWGETVGFPCTLAEERLFFDGFWDSISDDLDLSPTNRQRLKALDYRDYMSPFPDARPALLEVKQRGLCSGVLSNFSLASLEPSLEAVGLADLVDVACAATVIGSFKPDPEAYLTVTQALSVSPETCLFFDDEADLVEGAWAVGLQAYWVDRRRSTHALAENVVCDLSALPLLLNTENSEARTIGF